MRRAVGSLVAKYGSSLIQQQQASILSLSSGGAPSIHQVSIYPLSFSHMYEAPFLSPTHIPLPTQALPSIAAASSRWFATNSHDIFNVVRFYFVTCLPFLSSSASPPPYHFSFSFQQQQQHHEQPHNNWETEFDFTPANYKRVEEILGRYPTNWKQSAVIPLLDLAQQQNDGWLSLAAMNRVAKVLDMAEIRVYEVATFYTMFNRSKIGKYHVMVCGTTPCMLQGAKGIYTALKDKLGIDYGQTTSDGMFTLGEMECMGACVNAPMVAIADYSNGVEGFSYNYYEDLTPEDVEGIIETLKRGEVPKVGSQHRSKAEPAGAVVQGKWVSSAPGEEGMTLAGTPPGPYCRNLDEEAAAPPPPPK